MKRISAYFISLLAAFSLSNSHSFAQDTIDMPLKIRIGAEVSGPAAYFYDKNVLSTEGYLSVDLDEKRSVMFGAGTLNYKYSQYNYDYRAKGIFMRTGMDFNLLGPLKAQGKYWAGIGLHYGLSRFTSEIPSFQTENYWGTVSSSVGQRVSWGHFIEATPGVRAEIFRNVSIGWTMSARLLVYSGTGRDLRPLYFPGFGSGEKRLSTAMNYFITFNIPYKRIRVIVLPPPPEEPEEETVPAVGPNR